MPYLKRHEIYDATIRRMVREGLEQKEATFATEHKCDSETMLLVYVCKCAAELGHSPHAKEIVGWKYLLEYFGTWENVLRKAHLPLPRTPNHPADFLLIQEEIELQKKNYRRKKAEKKERSRKRIKEQKEKAARKQLEQNNTVRNQMADNHKGKD